MSTTSPKRKVRMLVALLFLPGTCLVVGGVVDFYWRWASIQNPVMVTGTVESAMKSLVRSSAGEGEEDRVRVSFPIANGETATHEASVGSRFFFSVGAPTRVRYNAADPKQAMITGFFGEPAEGSFFVLFGAFWLAFPTALVLLPKVDPARKQELIDKLRAAQRKQEEEEEAEARENLPRGAASPYREDPGASEARSTASQKKAARVMRIGFFYAPAFALITLGALIYLWVWSSIENPVTVTGTVERIYTYTQRDSDGERNEDRVVVSFPIADGKTATRDAMVGPTLFFSVGDPARVRYNAEDPTKAMITGFFGEPGATGSMILIGSFWLALPLVLRRFMRVDPARKQELIDKLRAAQKRNEEE